MVPPMVTSGEASALLETCLVHEMAYAYRWPGLGTEPQLGLQLSGLLELEPLPWALLTLT